MMITDSTGGIDHPGHGIYRTPLQKFIINTKRKKKQGLKMKAKFEKPLKSKSTPGVKNSIENSYVLGTKASKSPKPKSLTPLKGKR
jgi:hypothetical protein